MKELVFLECEEHNIRYPEGSGCPRCNNLKKRYSGELSRGFWDLINSIENENLHKELYCLGCELQNLEHIVLKKLEEHKHGNV